jgi:hypothetical protein
MNSTLPKYILLLFFFVMFCFSCSKSNVDKSLTIEEYMKLGVPDPTKEWHMDDFSQARAALGKIKWDKPYQLPMKDSKKSGSLFDHMLSPINMSFLNNQAMSLNEKAERISAFAKVYDYWIDVYSNPVINNYYHRELIYIQLFNLGIMDNMVALGMEINKSDDPTAVVLQYGFSSIKRNYLDCLTTDLKTQSYASRFLEKDLDTMADSVYTSVIRNKVWMDSNAIIDLKQSLKIVIDSTSSEHIRETYKNLEKSLSL